MKLAEVRTFPGKLMRELFPTVAIILGGEMKMAGNITRTIPLFNTFFFFNFIFFSYVSFIFA